MLDDLVGFLPNTLRGCAAEVSLPKPVVVLSAELDVGAILDSSSIGSPSEVMNISANVDSLMLDGVLVGAEGLNLDCFEVVGDCGVPTIFVKAPWSDPGRTRSILIWPTTLGFFVGENGTLSKSVAVVFLISLLTSSKSMLS